VEIYINQRPECKCESSCFRGVTFGSWSCISLKKPVLEIATLPKFPPDKMVNHVPNKSSPYQKPKSLKRRQKNPIQLVDTTKIFKNLLMVHVIVSIYPPDLPLAGQFFHGCYMNPITSILQKIKP